MRLNEIIDQETLEKRYSGRMTFDQQRLVRNLEREEISEEIIKQIINEFYRRGEGMADQDDRTPLERFAGKKRKQPNNPN